MLHHTAAAPASHRSPGRWSPWALLLAAGAAAAQQAEPAAAPSSASSSLVRSDGMIVLDYQQLRVSGDQPIDFVGLHVHNKLTDGLYLSAGVYAPLAKGEYGGFTAFDAGLQFQHRLWSRLFATAGVSIGGGGGGRSIEQSTALSGTGMFTKGHVGLGWEFDSFSAGVSLSRMRFQHSAIAGTQANFFVQIPYSWLSGPETRHGELLSDSDAGLALRESGENVLTLVLDNFHQIDPQGSNKGDINVGDLQFAHYFARDTFWYAGLGVGYHGLPLYNQVIVGIGQRLRLSQRWALYGQLGIGSGGYAPEVMDTDSGLLVYPKLAAEYMVTKNLGLALSAGYLVAPEGTSKNWTWGLALNYHLRSGGESAAEAGGAARFQAFRFSLFGQDEFNVSWRDIGRDNLSMVGLQLDTLLGERWYVPLQAAVATSDYLGYPGYGEVLVGLGAQTLRGPGERWQAFGQLMVGTNVHGTAVKANAGVRYGLSERWALHLTAGTMAARNSSGARFRADSVALGLDYRFAVPVW